MVTQRANHTLNSACSEDFLLQKIGCVWTGEFYFNTILVDKETFGCGKKKLRIQNYPDTCGRLTPFEIFYVVSLPNMVTHCNC